MTKEETKVRIEEYEKNMYELLKDISTLLLSISKALEDVENIETEEDAKKFDKEHDLEEGLEHIELF